MRPALRFLLGSLVTVAIAAMAAPAAGASPGQAAQAAQAPQAGQGTQAVPARTWRQVPSPVLPDGSGITAIAAVSITDAWAAGWTPSGGLIEHWNGARWRLVPAPAANLVSITASSPSDVWVTSQTSASWQLFHWNGTGWSDGAAGLPQAEGPGYGDVRPAVSDRPATGAWAAVNVNVPEGTGTIAGAAVFRWDGTSWQQVGTDITVPGPAKPPWYAEGAPAAVTPDDVWLGGINQSADPADGDSAHWDGSAWTVSQEVQGATPCCQVIISPSGGQLWAHGSFLGVRTGQPIIASLAGSSWQWPAAQPSGNDIMSADTLASDGLGNVWVRGPQPGPVGGNSVLHWDGASWAQQSFPGNQAAINDIENVPGTPVVWAVGTYTASDGGTRPLFDITAP